MFLVGVAHNQQFSWLVCQYAYFSMQSKSLLRFNSSKAASISSIATLPPHAL